MTACKIRASVIKLPWVEAVLWLAPALALLWVYVGSFGAPVSSVRPHLKIIGLLLICFWCLRYIGHVSIHSLRYKSVIITLAIFFIAVAYSIMLGYYLVVWAGLRSWGNVVSWQLVSTYLMRIDVLLDAFEISGVTVAVCVTLIVAAIWSAFIWLYRVADWPSLVAAGQKRFALVVAMALLIASAFELFVNSILYADNSDKSPIALTINPVRVQLQSSSVSRSPLLAQAETRARQTYASADIASKPNVILFVVDALRADHMHVNGYERSTTPYLDRLMKEHESISLPHIHSVCAESSCGLMALMSSRNMHQFVEKPFSFQEVLATHGYDINLILGGDHTNFYGLREAYGAADYYFDGSMADRKMMNDDTILTQALEIRTANPQPRPAFFQFHLMSVHALGKRGVGGVPFQPARSIYAALARRPVSQFSTEDRLEIINNYDNGIIDADHIIYKILKTLEYKNYLDNALVVITADHGELLGEAGMYTHAASLRRAVLNIPLVMIKFGRAAKAPFGAMTRLHGSQIDIAPTILAELGFPIPESWKGLPLGSSFDEQRRNKLIYFQQGREVGLIDQRHPLDTWKYIDEVPRENNQRAFNIAKDWSEVSNLISNISTSQRKAWDAALLDLAVIARTH